MGMEARTMIIRKVVLRNIKSYKEADITLRDGITGIAGLNGAGKSTILEAIGFALFDSAAYGQADFVRKGEKTGEATIMIEGADGLNYYVSRKFGSTQSYTITDSLGNRIEGKDEVGRKLCQILGYKVTDAGQLKSLFENAVGVLQGTFASEFLVTAAKRKQVFDPLLRIDEYDAVYKGLLPVKTLVKERINTLEKDISYHQGKASSLTSLEEQKQKQEAEAAASRAAVEEKSARLADVRAKKERMDAQEDALRRLANELNVAKAESEGKKREHDRIGGRLIECESAEKIVLEYKDRHLEYQSKTSEKESLDKRRYARDALKSEQSGVMSKLAEQRAMLAEKEKRLAEIASQEKDIEGLKDAIARQDVLEAERDRIKPMIKAKENELLNVRKNHEKAKGSKGNLCPILSVECKSVTDFSSYFKTLTDGIIAEKARSEAELASVESDLKALGNPRLKADIKKDALAQKPKIEAEKAAVAGEVKRLEGQKQAFDDRLKESEGLEDAMKAVDDRLKALKPASDAYQQNVKAAAMRPEVQRALDFAKVSLDECGKKISGISASIDERKAAYDATIHQNTKTLFELLTNEVTSLNATIAGIVKRIASLDSEIVQVRESLRAIDNLNVKKAEEEHYLAFIDWMRDAIKKAGPEVIRIYIELISQEATRIYGDIAGDHEVQIKWTQDYDIVLVEKGRERFFRQLSGGEQMSAALAVRLAILRILTGSDIVFLDEPTQNMDERRRQNLASQIARIRDFRQVIVISHDDTFNANLENVIEIEKVDGESRVRRRG